MQSRNEHAKKQTIGKFVLDSESSFAIYAIDSNVGHASIKCSNENEDSGVLVYHE